MIDESYHRRLQCNPVAIFFKQRMCKKVDSAMVRWCDTGYWWCNRSSLHRNRTIVNVSSPSWRQSRHRDGELYDPLSKYRNQMVLRGEWFSSNSLGCGEDPCALSWNLQPRDALLRYLRSPNKLNDKITVTITLKQLNFDTARSITIVNLNLIWWLIVWSNNIKILTLYILKSWTLQFLNKKYLM